MVNEWFVSVPESEDRYTVARVKDRLAPDAADDMIAAYEVQRDWVTMTADDNYVGDDVPYGLMMYEGDPALTEMASIPRRTK